MSENWLATLTEHVTPADIKDLLPIDWVINELMGLGVSNRKIRCPNPHHKDDTPSFNVWSANGSGVLNRMGCYGCDYKGDVFDVIQGHFGVTFSQAFDIATDDLLPKYQGVEWTGGRDDREYVSPEEMAEKYNELLSFGTSDYVLQKFLKMKEMLYVGEYAQSEWRWQGHAGSACVSMPHFDPYGNLTGVKFRDPRDMKRKWGMLGSHYSYLYGSWRDRGFENVVLCEGETDTCLSAYQLQDRDCDVMGIPTGVAQLPSLNALGQLKGRRTWIVFDGEMVSLESAQRWQSQISGQAEIRLAPEGRDIVNCGVSVATILGLKEKNGD